MALASCEDEMDINVLASKPKIAVFCYPSPANDTTVIDISGSLPIKNANGNTGEYSSVLNNLNIKFSVNGEERKVEYAENMIGSVVQGNYFSVGKINTGDKVTFEASADGFESVKSTTIVPETPKILDIHTTTAVHDNTEYKQFVVDIDGRGMKGNYYAVTINVACQFDKTPWNVDEESGDTIFLAPEHYNYDARQWLDLTDEPLLSDSFDDDMLFDFGSDYYSYFYIFDGNNVTSDKYSMRLNLPDYWWRNQIAYNPSGGDGKISNFSGSYVVRLYRIDPAMYKFFRSINELDGNDFAQYGLASFNTTYSNVKNGIGVVGAYNYSEIKERIEYGK